MPWKKSSRPKTESLASHKSRVMFAGQYHHLDGAAITLITCAKIVVAGSHWQSTAKPSRRSSNACNRTGDGGCPVDSLPGGVVAGPDDTSSSGRGSISSPSLGQQCPVHRPRSSFGWRANDDFARCLEECPLFDPDSTEPDWDRSQIEFEETDSDDDGAGVRAGAAMVLLGFRGPNGDQVPPQHMDTGDEDAEARAAATTILGIRSSNDSEVPPEDININSIGRAQHPPNNGEILLAEGQDDLSRGGRKLISDLGPRWAAPTSCRRPRKKPKRFEN